MNNEELNQLCLSLLHADTESEVIQLLHKKGFWDDTSLWRYYGDMDGNYSIIGSQQSRPEAALVEKIINSVDALLMNECWLAGVSPEDSSAPRSIHEAVALYFGGNAKKVDTLGYIGYWDDKKRTEVSRFATLAATGSTKNLCFTIADAGEGQTPNSMPTTILSLNKKNKQKIQFVQGKYNMGGTGVMRFCGHRNLQLVICRRNPRIARNMTSDDSGELWGFTIVRREDPLPGEKSSVYTYLAPVDASQRARMGGVLRFSSETLPIFPDGNAAYARSGKWGTVIKLYGYDATGFRSHILLRDGLLSRLDILLPEIALPLRLHECRDYRGDSSRSFETTLTGLSVRLEDDKARNLEEGFPKSSPLSAGGEQMTATIYAFKRGKEETYKKKEGIIFTINGQTHAILSQDFFGRTKVGMGRLSDSLLVIVDCSNLRRRACEDLFMNSRDRLANCDLRDAIERELEIMIKEHQGLQDLRERRKREEMGAKLSDSKPLEETLKSILKSYPSLASMFLAGARLPNPFKTKQVAAADVPYEGKLHPSYFKFQKLDYGQKLKHRTAVNMRCRITFETDVVDDYFHRLENKGTFTLRIISNNDVENVQGYSLNLEHGKATLNVRLPPIASVGEVIEYEAKATDDTLLEPFVNRFLVTVAPSQQVSPAPPKKKTWPPIDEDGHGRELPTGFAIPEIKEVYERDWEQRKPKFDRYSALQVVQEEAADSDTPGNGSPAVYSFWVNMDNIYFKSECKSSKQDAEILKARWIYGLALMGMSLIQANSEAEKSEPSDESKYQSEEREPLTLVEQVFKTSAAVSPILLPLIESLGSLTAEQISTGSRSDDG